MLKGGKLDILGALRTALRYCTAVSVPTVLSLDMSCGTYLATLPQNAASGFLSPRYPRCQGPQRCHRALSTHSPPRPRPWRLLSTDYLGCIYMGVFTQHVFSFPDGNVTAGLRLVYTEFFLPIGESTRGVDRTGAESVRERESTESGDNLSLAHELTYDTFCLSRLTSK